MKNNRTKLVFVVTAVVIGLIGIFLITKKNDSNVEPVSSTQSNEIATFDSSSPISEDVQVNTMNGTAPKWAQLMMDINNNQDLSRNEKIEKLVELLKNNNTDPQAQTDILVSLTALNPIEAVDDIIPYLQNSNPRVQSAALGALNNASLLTPEEHQQRKALPENEQKRKQIAEAVNELKANPDISDEVREALISTYSATNPSAEDSKKMNQEILAKDEISLNGASYLATSVLNGKEMSTTLKLLDTKNQEVKDSVISNIGTNILDNPNVVSTLSNEQRLELKEFISKNPPTTSNPNDFNSQTDQWKNTLSVLESYS